MIDLENIFVHGRFFNSENGLYLFNTASGIEFNFTGKNVFIKMGVVSNQQSEAWVKAIIDNDYDSSVDLKVGMNQEFTIFKSDDNEIHNIKILKASEAIESFVIIKDLKLTGTYLEKPKYEKEIFVFGDSTVSAFGNLGTVTSVKTLFDTDGLNGFAYLTAKAFNASLNSLNASGWGLCFSPWTTPKRRPLLAIYNHLAPFEDRLFDFKNHNPLAIIISLGTNDSFYFSLGEDKKPKEELIEEFMNDYHVFLTKLKNIFPNSPIFMVYGLMREQHNYDVIHNIYLNNKDEFNLYECKLEGDGLGVSGHPSIQSHKKNSEVLIKMIKETIGE